MVSIYCNGVWIERMKMLRVIINYALMHIKKMHNKHWCNFSLGLQWENVHANTYINIILFAYFKMV